MSSEDIKQFIANCLIAKPEHMAEVSVQKLPDTVFSAINNLVKPRGCYSNALIIGTQLNAAKVVLGFVYLTDIGLPVEHAWIELQNGTMADPTYQALSDDYNPSVQYQYFSIYKIKIEEYWEVMEHLDCGNQAIDLLSLRRSPLTRHIFQHQRVA